MVNKSQQLIKSERVSVDFFRKSHCKGPENRHGVQPSLKIEHFMHFIFQNI